MSAWREVRYTYRWLGPLVAALTGHDPRALKRLIDASHSEDKSYLAWELVRSGRAAQLCCRDAEPLGRVVINDHPKPHTGFEGYFAGATVADVAPLIVEAELRVSADAEYIANVVVDKTRHTIATESLLNHSRRRLAERHEPEASQLLTPGQVIFAEAGLGLVLLKHIAQDAERLSNIECGATGERLPYLSDEAARSLLIDSILNKSSLDDAAALPELCELDAYLEQLLAELHPLAQRHPDPYARFRDETYELLDALPPAQQTIHYALTSEGLTVDYAILTIDQAPARETRVCLPRHAEKAYDVLAKIGWVGLPLLRQLLHLCRSEPTRGTIPDWRTAFSPGLRC
jgi:hypothetical protein